MATKRQPSKESVTELKNILDEKNFDVQFEVSLCLTDFQKAHMRKGSNGKIYTDVIVGIRKEPDQWGRDLKVYEAQTRAERENHVAKNYVGGGRIVIFVRQKAEIPTDGEIESIMPFDSENEEENLPY